MGRLRFSTIFRGRGSRPYRRRRSTLENAIEKVREACRKHVNLSMAMCKLMHAKQGTKTVTEFAKELDQLATQCQFDKNP